MPGRRTRILLCSLWACLLVAVACGAATAAPRGTPHSGTQHSGMAVVAGGPGSAAALTGYRIQSSAKVTDSGATISKPGYAASGWYATGPRSTVVAGLLQ